MGSISGIALREANGTVHKTSGSSFDISWFVNNIRLANRDQNHIQRFLKDYDFTGKDHQDLRPVDAGLVVVDLVTNKILGYQNVTGVGYLNGIIIAEEARALIEEKSGDPNLPQNIRAAYQATGQGSDDYACVRFRELLESKRIKRIYDLKGSDQELVQVSEMSYEEVDALMRGKYLRCEIDLQPFEVITYRPYTVQGARDLQVQLAQLGFQTSAHETKAWKTWIADLN